MDCISKLICLEILESGFNSVAALEPNSDIFIELESVFNGDRKYFIQVSDRNKLD